MRKEDGFTVNTNVFAFVIYERSIQDGRPERHTNKSCIDNVEALFIAKAHQLTLSRPPETRSA